jgi:AcrR family transcriptional regulator
VETLLRSYGGAVTTTDRTVDTGRPLRRDAARNRALILAVAAQVFAEHGVHAGYDEIARRAGLGVGTVYRRFPERAELVDALFESRIADIVALGESAATRPVAWDGLVIFLESALEHQVIDRGLKDVMFEGADRENHERLGRDRIGPILAVIVARAQQEGSLRADVEASDLDIPLMMLCSVTTLDEPDLWRRYLALFLDGLRARPGLAPLPLAPPVEDVVPEVMRRLRGR